MAKIKTNNNLTVGINVSTQYDTTSRIFEAFSGERVFALITSERGPVNRLIPVTNLTSFKNIFGGYCEGTYGFPTAHVIYEGWGNGYSIKPMVFFCRVVGPAAAKSTYTVVDGAGADTWRFDASSEGEWGNNVQLKVEAGTSSATVQNPGAPPQLTTATTGGSIPAATYEFKYVWNNANGDTLGSQVGSKTTTGSESTITIASLETMPYGADKIKAYVKVSGNYRLAGTSASGAKTVTITTIPGSGTDQLPTTNTATIPTRKITIWKDGVFAYQIDDMEFTDADIEKFNKNGFVTITDLNSATAVPTNFPAVMASAAYLGGGTADLSNVDAATVVGTIAAGGTKTGLKVFRDDNLGTGTMIAPGFYQDSVVQELESQCETYYRLGVADIEYDTALDEVKTWADSAVIGGNTSTCMQVPFPGSRAWSNPDHAIGIGPERMWIPLSIDFAGARFLAGQKFGRFRPHAGDWTGLPFCPTPDATGIGGLYKDTYGNDFLDATTATDLGDNYGITAVYSPFQGSKPCIYDNVLKTTSNLIRFVQERLVLNYLYQNIKKNFTRADFVFRNLSSVEFNDVITAMNMMAANVMQAAAAQGGMVGFENGWLTENSNSGFRIVIDETNNSAIDLQQGIINVDIFYKNLPATRKIAIRLHPRNLTDPLG